MAKVNIFVSLVAMIVLSLFAAVLLGFALQIATAQQNSTGITSTNNNSTNFLTYSNSTYGIKIQYPPNWIKQESQNQSSNDIVKFSSPGSAAPASLAVIGGKPAPHSIPLQVYINTSIYVLRHSFDNFSLVESNTTTLGGFPAHKIVYTATIPSSGIEIKFMQILTIKDNKSLVITFGTLPANFSTYLPTIQQMIDSFAFIPVTTPAAIPSNAATIPAANATNAKQGFHSALDTFVVPGSVNGYGVYQAHNSSIFKPGEKILLYIEPGGYSYKPMGSLFLMNFTADVLVSDKAGHVLTGLQNLPISTLISHYKNKELLLTVSLTQTSPFPIGDYVLKYTIHDVPSGNSFDILRNIRIANR
jgi:hypothetical protein